MRLHILGICGTFMSGIAILAKQSGHEVVGSDENAYPPMSTQLMEQGIKVLEGYDPANIDTKTDCVIIGNVNKRGNPAVEYVLEQRIPYMSGPEWLAQNILNYRWVLAVAGTHGKTTVSSMIAWILDSAGLHPGFLIGGLPENFDVSARLGSDPFFVIEADEYDSAFFDKRAKFIHYRPKTLVLNNLEFDHADIYSDLDAIKRQFHHLVRTVPGNGLILHNQQESGLQDVLEQGVWTPCAGFNGGDWQARLIKDDGSVFDVVYQGGIQGRVEWGLIGQHNVANALAAVAAAHHAGVKAEVAIQSLARFKSVKRRLEKKGEVKQIAVYDDFAHHPTTIASTLQGLRARVGDARMIAVLEFGSYTMRTGVHRERIQEALKLADKVVCKQVEQDWDLKGLLSKLPQPTELYQDVDSLVEGLVPSLEPGDHVVVMSNSGFGNVHQKLLDALSV